MFDSEITVAVLDENENLLGYLNPKHTQITEVNGLYKHRTISIVCQLVDEVNTDLSKYDVMLTQGNKIWKESTTDGDSCLYVLRGNKEYGDDMMDVTVSGIEVSSELGQLKILRDDAFEWTVDSSFIATVAGELFDSGTLDGPTTTVDFNGAVTPLAILNEIQDKTGGEFQFRYEYDQTTDTIKRYIDFHDTVGVEHPGIIEIGYNTKGITLSIDEDDVGSAAGPTGKPSNATDTFHADRQAFEDLAITKGQSIPLWVTKDSSGNESYGPNVAAPYAKTAGEGWVNCDETNERVASYDEIQPKAGTSGDIQRIITFDSSETNKYNLYWLCVDKIREHLRPNVEISVDFVNLIKLAGTEDYYNIGDVVHIQLPAGTVVQCRITGTTKDPREPGSERIDISTYRSTFMQDFFQNKFKNPDSVVFS